MYKIKFGEHTLLILSDVCSFSFDAIGKNKATIYRYTTTKKFLQLVHNLSTSPIKTHVLIHQDTEQIFNELSSQYKSIIAGGGLVINELGQFLFIHRNGKWDLPKGKIESSETTELGALREVEEECGVKISKLIRPLHISYHTYIQDNLPILKSNHWYLMHADSKQNLIPQVEEGIDKVEWIEPQYIQNYLVQSYDAIHDVIKAYQQST